MQLFLRPFYNIIRQQIMFEWTLEHQKHFKEINTLSKEQKSNTIPDPGQPFYAMCDSSSFGIKRSIITTTQR